jgi:hypothetical protein
MMKKPIYSRCIHCNWYQRTTSRKRILCQRCGKTYTFNPMIPKKKNEIEFITYRPK